jgi:uncharacterized protein (TIGR00730 family)
VARVCVYCGSHTGAEPAFAEAAREASEALHRRGLGLVYGGGAVGLMGVVADRMLDLGGEAIGVIPDFMVERELAHPGLTDLRIVRSMHERKALMAELSDAFVALPGGWGTLDELVEALTWAQLGLHSKPVGLVNVGGYFEPLLAFQERAIRSAFVVDRRPLLTVAPTAESLLARLQPPEPASR